MSTNSVRRTHSSSRACRNSLCAPATVLASPVVTLFRRHHASLCMVAYRYVRSRAVAEELVQDVFLRICCRGEGGLPSARATDSEMGSYVFVAVRHAALNHVRRERVERRWHEGAMRESGTHCQTDPYDDVCFRDLKRAAEAAVEALPPRCRLIYRLTRQRSYMEVARSLEISPKTVENQVAIAIRALKRQLQEFVLVS